MDRTAEQLSRTKPFSTDHFYLAGFLSCRGHEVIGTEPGSNGRVNFLFQNTCEVQSAAAEFLSGGQVEARQFAFAILKMKKFLPRKQWRDLNSVVLRTPA
jgi:hypothetical protein